MSSFRCGLQVARKNVITDEVHNHPRGKQISCLVGDDMLGSKESNFTTDVISAEAQNEMDLEKVNKQQIIEQMGDDEQGGTGLLEYIYDLPVRKIASKLPLRKIGEKAIAGISNLFPSSDENARDMYPGEYHAIVKLPNGKYGRSSYTGPGTRVIQRLQRNGGDPPRVPSDKVSQAHDIRYTLAQNTDDVRAADKAMVRDLKQLSREGKDSQINIQPPLRGIQAKILAEDFSLLSRDKFIDVRNKPSDSDKVILESKIKQLQQQGYGSVRSMARAGSDIRGRPQVDRRGYRSLLERVKHEQYNTKGAMRNRNFRVTDINDSGQTLMGSGMRKAPYMRKDRNIINSQRGGAQAPGSQATASSEFVDIKTANKNTYRKKSKMLGAGYPGSNIVQVGSGVSLPGSGKSAFPADKLLKKMVKRIKKTKSGKYSGTRRKPIYVDEREMSGFIARKLAPLIIAR